MTAIGLLLVLEGISYAAFPKGMRETIMQVTQLPDSLIRRYGLVAAAIGLGIIYLERMA